MTLPDKPVAKSKTIGGATTVGVSVIIGTVSLALGVIEEARVGTISWVEAAQELIPYVATIATAVGGWIGVYGLRRKMGENGGVE